MPSFIIEHQCPQCGAPAELEETDRLFRCGFCRAGSYLTASGHFRYLLPHKAPDGKELIYFPYWRFKGMLFSCLTEKIDMRFIDVSHQAVPSMHFPVSVGFRSQTQKLRFAAEGQGTFIKPATDIETFLRIIDDRFSERLPKPILHQAHIGETLSLLYAPYYLDGRLHDAVINQPLAIGNPDDVKGLLSQNENPCRPLTFIPTLCPQCGWDLAGERDSLALHCGNCRSLWWVKGDQLAPLKTAHLPQKDGDPVYMPFWRIAPRISHVELNTYADLVKIANLPKVQQPGWDEIPFHFWGPAFKIKPNNLLTFAGNVTLQQPTQPLESGPPEKARLHAVTMPLQEAVESLKPMFSGFMRPRQRMVAILKDLEITARDFLLVYLPFREDHHELINDRLQLAINKSVLAHSRNL